MSLQISFKDYIKYNPKVGVDYLHIIGLPGFGKSSQLNMILLMCMQLGEIVVMPGDRFCEWRHFLNYPKTVKKITLIVPQGELIEYTNFPEDITKKYGISFERLELNYRDFRIMDIISENARSEVFVIYDQHYRTIIQNNDEIIDLLYQRSLLWAKINTQLNDRITHLDKAIVTPFHEAMVYWDQYSSDEQWKAIKTYAKSLVDNRKGLTRPIFLSQEETEVESTVRNKCVWKFYRKGSTKKDSHPHLKKVVPWTARHKYQMVYGGLHVAHNTIDPIKEIHNVWKMIPQGIPLEYLESKEQKEIEKKQKEGLKIEREQKLMLERLEERKANQEYIIEKEMEYKLQLKELEYKKKRELLELEETQKAKKYIKSQNDYEQIIQKGIITLTDNPDITITQFGTKIGVSYFAKQKTVYEQCKNIMSLVLNSRKIEKNPEVTSPA